MSSKIIMDALILSCGTGGGHNAAGEAIMEELLRRGHHVEMLDPYTLKSERTADIINEAYIKLVQKAPAVFGAIYELGNLYRRLPFRSPVYYANKKMVAVMEKFLSQKQFDIIIATHIFPSEILANMKQQGFDIPNSVYIATDYTCIPFTEESACDYYIIPTEEQKKEFIRWGICEEKIIPLGIPVKHQFRVFSDQKTTRKNLGLELEKRYILVSGGSIGAGNLERVIALLLEHYKKDAVELVVVCGNNHHLYEKVKKAYEGQLILLEYTNRMAEYMKACDLVITKPGGLSTTEAAVSGTSLILVTPIPGCESHNMSFFEEQGMSAAVRFPGKQLLQICDKLMREDERTKMAEKQKNIINANAASDICDFIERDIVKKSQNSSYD